ncbi:hypothetical protein Mapa_001120 [Marchantia paleacea]|nr:hypothetical protein Mapa_001120 [Marchantia paleacea]
MTRTFGTIGNEKRRRRGRLTGAGPLQFQHQRVATMRSLTGPATAGYIRVLSDRLEWEGQWANIASEILVLVLQKVQERAAADNDEMRRVVAMAAVCRSWRLIIQSHIAYNPFSSTGLLQFPSALRESGPPDKPMQCVMRRKGGTFVLYQSDCGSGQELRESKCNFMLGACKRWRPGHMMFMISADRRSFSRRSFGFMGKLRSNFWGTAFVLWDYHNSGSSRDGTSKARPVTFVRFTEDMVDGVGQRKMTCVVRAPRNKPRGLVCPISQHGMNACFSPLAAKTFWRWSCISNMNNSFRSAHAPRGYQSLREDIGKSIMEEKAITRSDSPPMDNLQKKLKLSGVPGLLKKGEKVAMFTSKIPEWDVQRQCWSLDFKGRATLPSMHNFQLLLPEGTSRPLDVSSEDGESSDEARGDEDRREDSVVMQLGKIGKGLYALDYRYPLSAFQAFNIALSSFATTVGVEP